MPEAPEFKVGDRVRTTAFPGGVTEARGHKVGDVGTVVGHPPSRPDHYLVRFDRSQGLERMDRDGVLHKHVWHCDAGVLEPFATPTPEEIAEVIAELNKLVDPPTSTWAEHDRLEWADDIADGMLTRCRKIIRDTGKGVVMVTFSTTDVLYLVSAYNHVRGRGSNDSQENSDE
jgi:hypothetical protein